LLELIGEVLCSRCCKEMQCVEVNIVLGSLKGHENAGVFDVIVSGKVSVDEESMYPVPIRGDSRDLGLVRAYPVFLASFLEVIVN
jgi:hypothetical protein